jgi:hypothetical protein
MSNCDIARGLAQRVGKLEATVEKNREAAEAQARVRSAGLYSKDGGSAEANEDHTESVRKELSEKIDAMPDRRWWRYLETRGRWNDETGTARTSEALVAALRVARFFDWPGGAVFEIRRHSRGRQRFGADEAQYLEEKGLLKEANKVISPENKQWFTSAAGRDFLAEQGHDE